MIFFPNILYLIIKLTCCFRLMSRRGSAAHSTWSLCPDLTLVEVILCFASMAFSFTVRESCHLASVINLIQRSKHWALSPDDYRELRVVVGGGACGGGRVRVAMVCACVSVMTKANCPGLLRG